MTFSNTHKSRFCLLKSNLNSSTLVDFCAAQYDGKFVFKFWIEHVLCFHIANCCSMFSTHGTLLCLRFQSLCFFQVSCPVLAQELWPTPLLSPGPDLDRCGHDCRVTSTKRSNPADSANSLLPGSDENIQSVSLERIITNAHV